MQQLEDWGYAGPQAVAEFQRSYNRIRGGMKLRVTNELDGPTMAAVQYARGANWPLQQRMLRERRKNSRNG